MDAEAMLKAYRSEMLPNQLLVWSDAAEEAGETELAERLRKDAGRAMQSWYGRVAVPFLSQIAKDLGAAGFPCEVKLTSLTVCGVEIPVRATRSGNIKLLQSTFRVNWDATYDEKGVMLYRDVIFSTKVATKRVIQRVARHLSTEQRIAALERADQLRQQAVELIGEAMLR